MVKNSLFSRTGIGLTLALGFLMGMHGDLHASIDFMTWKEHAITFKETLHTHYYTAALFYALLTMLAVTFSIPIVLILALIAGFLFGTVSATIILVIGVLLGAILYFLAIRYLLKKRLEKKYAAQLARFNAQLRKLGISYVLILHYLTIVPFFVINTCAALSDISLVRFIAVTFAGSVPVLFVYALAGKELARLNSTAEIFSGNVIIALALLIVLALVPILVRRYKGALKL